LQLYDLKQICTLSSPYRKLGCIKTPWKQPRRFKIYNESASYYLLRFIWAPLREKERDLFILELEHPMMINTLKYHNSRQYKVPTAQKIILHWLMKESQGNSGQALWLKFFEMCSSLTSYGIQHRYTYCLWLRMDETSTFESPSCRGGKYHRPKFP
jgi:hypothetical protein